MLRGVVKAMGQSRILNFLGGFNRKAVIFFYNSMTYKIFFAASSYINKTIVKAVPTSRLINAFRNVLNFVSIRDVGLFIVLVVVFNTAGIIFLGSNIDAFSAIARIVFFVLGFILILKKR